MKRRRLWILLSAFTLLCVGIILVKAFLCPWGESEEKPAKKVAQAEKKMNGSSNQAKPSQAISHKGQWWDAQAQKWVSGEEYNKRQKDHMAEQKRKDREDVTYVVSHLLTLLEEVLQGKRTYEDYRKAEEALCEGRSLGHLHEYVDLKTRIKLSVYQHAVEYLALLPKEPRTDVEGKAKLLGKDPDVPFHFSLFSRSETESFTKNYLEKGATDDLFSPFTEYLNSPYDTVVWVAVQYLNDPCPYYLKAHPELYGTFLDLFQQRHIYPAVENMFSIDPGKTISDVMPYLLRTHSEQESSSWQLDEHLLNLLYRSIERIDRGYGVAREYLTREEGGAKRVERFNSMASQYYSVKSASGLLKQYAEDYERLCQQYTDSIPQEMKEPLKRISHSLKNEAERCLQLEEK